MPNFTGFSWELVRKTLHLSSLLVVIGYTLLLNYTSERIAIMAVTAVLLVLLEIEHLRIEHRPKLMAVLEGLLRNREKDGLSGAAYMIISCIICFAAFEYWVAFLALFMAVFGDMFAAIFGKAFGGETIRHDKTFIGTLAGLAANLIVGLLILPQYPLLVIAMAVTATLVELFTHKLDDNLTVPLVSGFIGQMAVYLSNIALPPVDFTFLGLF